MLQPLEPRRLLSVSATFENGVITVMGTPTADQITVSTGPPGGWSIKSGEAFVPVETGEEQVVGIMVMGGGRDDVISVDLEADDIDVSLYGHSGNDTISVNTHGAASVDVYGGHGAVTIAADYFGPGSSGGTIDGMWANDVITVRSGVGSYAPRVYGGSGDDVIRATTQLHSATGQAVWGGPGNDAITLANVDLAVPVTNVARGEAGNDYITGSDGRDLLFGDEGNDMIRGGAGDDVIFGGAGNDRMYGHAGDDYFDGGLGKDRISGEDGYDFALEDKLDDVAGVELLI